MRRMCIALWLMAMPALARDGGAALQAVLDAIPDEAALAVIAPNLEKLAAGLSEFGRAIGVDELAQLTAKQLTEDTLDNTEGLDTTGAFVVGLNPDSLANRYLICRLKDAELWKKAHSATPGEGAFSGLLRFKLQGEHAHALIRGDAIVIAAEGESLQSAQQSKGRMAELLKPQRELLDSHQLVIAIDVPRWDESVRDSFTLVESVMKMSMASAPDPKVAEMTTAYMRWMSAKLRELVADSKSLTLGLRFGTDGVRATQVWTVKPGGSIAEYLAKVKKSSASPLRGLSPGPFAAAFGFEWEMPPGTPSLTEEMNKILIESTPGADRANLETIIRKSSEMQKKVSGLGGAAHAAADGGLLVSLVYHTGEGPRVAKEMADLTETATGGMNLFSFGVSARATRSAERMAGRDVDVFAWKFSSQDPAMTAAMNAAYGESPHSLLGARDEAALLTMGQAASARERMESLLTAKPNAFAEQPRVATALKQIAPEPQIVVVLDLLQLVELFAKIAERISGRIPPIKLGGEPTALIAAGIYLRAGEIRAEAVVPAEPIRTLIKAASPDAGGEGPKE